MIKTGLILSSPLDAAMVRLLLNHPDVELRWLATPAGTQPALSELIGECSPIPSTPDWEATDLYIGPVTDDVVSRLTAPDSRLRAIFSSPGVRADEFPDGVAALGVAEYNRKALVRGARVATMPSLVTMLGALALMPLAKNLLLGNAVGGAVLMPDHSALTGSANFCLPGTPLPQTAFAELRSAILSRLQTSCNTEFSILPILTSVTTFASGTFSLPVNMPFEDLVELYHSFYDDHRHVVISATNALTVTDSMVLGTNKAVVSLLHDAERQLRVSVALDARMRLGAGNVLHLLNLLFGLDERTGF